MNKKSVWILLIGLTGLLAAGVLVAACGLVWLLKPHSRTYRESLASVMTGQSTIQPLGGIEIRPGRILREVREPVEGLTRTEVEYQIHGPRLDATVTAHAFENDSKVLGYQKFVVQFSDGTQLNMRGKPISLEEAKAEAVKPKPPPGPGRL